VLLDVLDAGALGRVGDQDAREQVLAVRADRDAAREAEVHRQDALQHLAGRRARGGRPSFERCREEQLINYVKTKKLIQWFTRAMRRRRLGGWLVAEGPDHKQGRLQTRQRRCVRHKSGSFRAHRLSKAITGARAGKGGVLQWHAPFESAADRPHPMVARRGILRARTCITRFIGARAWGDVRDQAMRAHTLTVGRGPPAAGRERTAEQDTYSMTPALQTSAFLPSYVRLLEMTSGAAAADSASSQGGVSSAAPCNSQDICAQVRSARSLKEPADSGKSLAWTPKEATTDIG